MMNEEDPQPHETPAASSPESSHADETNRSDEAAAGNDGNAPDEETAGSDETPQANPPANADAAVDQQAEIDALRDKWLRAVAELENHKKRVRRDIEDAVQRVTQQLLTGFLPVVDNLERALEAASDRDDQIVKGVQMVAKEFMTALSRQNITPIESVGKPFDPAFHEALQQKDSADHVPGTVILEFERGYKMGERLLRPARVVIAGTGSGSALAPADEAEESEELPQAETVAEEADSV